jgi:hypothetical protein
MENRAAVFTSQPQAVEVYQSGAWWPGELLGWRHDTNGTCQVWVRVVLGGVEESAWTDLTTLRLPERHLAVVPEVAPAQAFATQEMAAARVAPAAPCATAGRDLAETASLPLLRDRPAAPGRGATAGPSSGGRRRAPEDGASTARPASASAASGRHRAPADPGRHRAAADTGLLPAVSVGSDDRPTAVRPAVGKGRPNLPSRAPRVAESQVPSLRDGWSAQADPEPELLTRPMRLSDLSPHSRRPRLDGSLAGV